jgi:hypothetical protein
MPRSDCRSGADSLRAANHEVKESTAMTSSVKRMMLAGALGRKIVTPSTARPALVRIVERHGNLTNVPELARRVKKVRRTMRVASVSQS